MIDYINTGCDPDAPTGRCYGPAYPDSPGCGRFARGGMCARCEEASRQYWLIDLVKQSAWEDEQIAKHAEQEAAYHAAEMAAHPPTVTACDWCGYTGPCSWQVPGYICVDRALCDARCLDLHERNLGFQAERDWSREEAQPVNADFEIGPMLVCENCGAQATHTAQGYQFCLTCAQKFLGYTPA